MTKRVVLAGIVGGVVLFVWLSVAHVFLGLGAVGIRELPNEASVVTALQGNIQEPGLYIFPGTGLGPNATREQQAAAMTEMEKKAETGPNGLLMIHPQGGGGFTAARLVHEFVLNVVQCLLLALLLAWMGAASYASRVGFIAVAGLFGASTTTVQYWNWYGFPTNYTLAYMFTDVVGFFLAGLVIAALIKARAVKATA